MAIPSTRPARLQRSAIRIGRLDARRQAVAGLAVLVSLLLLAQPASTALVHFEYSLGSIPDPYQTWTDYLNQPSRADVAFVGDSQSYYDLDTGLLTERLSAEAGRPVTLARLGFFGERPDFLSVLVYRMAHLPRPPRLLVFELQFTSFNQDLGWDPTYDLWQISQPWDADFARRAYRIAPDGGRLARGWVVPYLTAYPALSTLTGCGVAQAAAQRWGRTSTVAWLVGPDPCDTPGDYALVQMSRSRLSSAYTYAEAQAGYVREAVAIARTSGIRVMFVHYPFRRLHELGGDASDFIRRTGALAAELSVPLADFSYRFEERDDAWRDPLHLNATGARALAPELAAAVARER